MSTRKNGVRGGASNDRRTAEPDYVLDGARAKKAQAAAANTFGIDNFHGHDLRRTAASLMTSSGTPRLVVSKVLNHSEPGITAVYDRHSYDTGLDSRSHVSVKRVMFGSSCSTDAR